MCPQISVKIPHMKFHETPSYMSRCSGIWMARRTQMTKAMSFLPIVFKPVEQFSNTHYFIYLNFLFAPYHNEVLMWYSIGQDHNFEVNLRNKLTVLKLRFIYCSQPWIHFSKAPSEHINGTKTDTICSILLHICRNWTAANTLRS
jgi:hypothetical protein